VAIRGVTPWDDGTVSLFQLVIQIRRGPAWDQWTFWSAHIPPPSSWDETVSVDVTIRFPVRERKEVRLGSGPAPYDWLPPDVELAYALHLFHYLSGGTTYGFLGDGSEKATLWAREKDKAKPKKLSFREGVPATPSYLIVRHR
jgi:hypothetical protein